MNQSFSERVIYPSQKWYEVDWQSLYEYRELLMVLVKRDWIHKFKQTLLGPIWFILQPLLMTFIFMIVFGKLLKVPTGGIPQELFFLLGTLVWNYFSNTLQVISKSLIDNSELFNKVFFPRIYIPLSILISKLLPLVLQGSLLLLLYGYHIRQGVAVRPTAFCFLLPVFLIQAQATSLGVGLWLASLTIRFRDFQHLIPLTTQAWLYLTPVIYPASIIPERWVWLGAVNPMATVFEGVRLALFGEGKIILSYFLFSWMITSIILFTGLIIFNRVERTCVDSL